MSGPRLKIIRTDDRNTGVHCGDTGFGVSVDGEVSEDVGDMHVWIGVGSRGDVYAVKVKSGVNAVWVGVKEDGTMHVSAERQTGRRQRKKYGTINLWFNKT